MHVDLQIGLEYMDDGLPVQTYIPVPHNAQNKNTTSFLLFYYFNDFGH